MLFLKNYHPNSFLRTVAILLITVLVFSACFSALFTLPLSAKEDKIRIVLDPGHGGYDGGAASSSQPEKYYNFEVAKYCKAALEKTGKFDVYLTRESDVYKTHLERAVLADSVNADIMLSMHFNSSNVSEIKGGEIIVSTIEKFALNDLAYIMKNSLIEEAKLTMRGSGIFTRPDTGDGTYLYYWSDEYNWDIPGDKTAGPLSDFYGITTWGCKLGIPTVIVEYAYISNEEDLAIVDNSDNLKKMAEATASALEKFYTGHKHSYSESTVDYPTSCVLEGKASRKCTVCGHKTEVRALSDTPDETAHCFLKVKTVASTCKKRGYVLYECRYHSNLIDKGYYGSHAPSCHSKKVYLDYADHEYTRSTSDDMLNYIYSCKTCDDSYSEFNPYGYMNYIFDTVKENTIGIVTDFFIDFAKRFFSYYPQTGEDTDNGTTHDNKSAETKTVFRSSHSYLLLQKDKYNESSIF